MSGFSNPIIGGGGALVYPSIHSPNFITGVSGWTIRKDGTAEFSGLTLRGTFSGTDFVINNLGAFFYSGAPATGNLIASITGQAGANDGFGNAFKAGITTYTGAGNTAQLLNQTLFMENAADFAAAQVTAGGGPLLLISGKSTSLDIDLIMQINSRLTSVSGTVGQVFITEDVGNVAVTARILELAGSLAVTGNVHRVQGGTEETLHALGLQNGWTNNAPALQYRRIVSPPNEVEILGDISAGTIANGTQIANALPAAYQPATPQTIEVVTVGNTASPVRTPIVTVSAAGVISCFGLPTGTTSIRFPARSSYSLDAT